jgi:hypothetical protein
MYYKKATTYIFEIFCFYKVKRNVHYARFFTAKQLRGSNEELIT